MALEGRGLDGAPLSAALGLDGDHGLLGNPAYVVGIGASAEGSEALGSFFEAMPDDCGMVFVVVQRHSADRDSHTMGIPGKFTGMPIVLVEQATVMKTNYVYVTPPGMDLTIRGDFLIPVAQPVGNGEPRLPIDRFFKSLAEEAGRSAVGIVLSGTGTDGARGMGFIKNAGGLVLTPDTGIAMFDSVPGSAIRTDDADRALSPGEMGAALVRYSRSRAGDARQGDTGVCPAAAPSALAAAGQTPEDIVVNRLFDRIKRSCGIDFAYYKRSGILRRIERRMRLRGVPDYPAYAEYVDRHPDELLALRKDMLIGVTNFFRDPEAFDALYDRVLPALFKGNSREREIRIWVAGCSTGEEAYSVAILVRRYLDLTGRSHAVKIFATDLDGESVEYASQGFYSESAVHRLSQADISSYLIQNDGMYRVSLEIRKMIVFAPHNLIKDPPFSSLDLITCRNMLIYLQPEMQAKVLSLFHFALNPGAYLFLGPSETIGPLADRFEPLDRRWNIFSRKSEPGRKRSTDMDDAFNAVRHDPSSSECAAECASSPDDELPKLANDLYRTLACEHVLPGMIVGPAHDVVQLHGDIDAFLLQSKGRAAWNLYNIVDSGLAVAIATAIQKVRQEKREIVFRSVKARTAHGDRLVDVTVRPLSLKSIRYERHMLVLFEEAERELPPPAIPPVAPQDPDSAARRIAELERALRRTEETLQATIEELETSNEELRATNEQLTAANEELQSTNEELQSVNEELITVNAEYQFKIQELTELNDDMVNFLGSTQIGTIFLDKRLCVRRFTPAITKEINLLDIDCGRPLAHISHSFRYDSLVESAAEVLKSRLPFETEIQSKSGAWYHMHILPYRTTDNFVNGVVLTFVDITELKSSNEEMLRFSYALEQSPSMVVITDVAGAVEYVNPKFAETTGFALNEIRGRKLDLLSDWAAAEADLPDMIRTIRAGGTWKGELTSMRRDGTCYRESAKVVPITDTDGETIHYLKLSEDITELRHAEEMLQKNEMLSAMGQLAAGIAHEIRNPLTSLKGFTKLISSGIAKESYAEIMMNELSRIEMIVSELLVLAKPQALDFAHKEAGAILHDVVMLLESQANLNNVELFCNVEKDLPPVRCVENQIKQVFINMIKNGIEAMPAGGRILISAKLEEERHLRIRFTDNGPGIPESKLARLGQPFFTTKEKGTGLGLTVCYKIMENHHGSIRFQSEVGRGTTVTVTLPVYG
ncbi:CheR family methyltransferase [Cohnella sp. JJ-181]|uniref:CheR family methyltransferase n=1 Tax=Cohnella rhizoplanae TaxID=2974897 RepID=UPI0022FF611C|nr:CheR family methyltransferase [Cohnella sp. JJ-181]CAI6076463.1 Adaptive-response sensory-kinase SasA [Cohnella sp. JJ-181]